MYPKNSDSLSSNYHYHLLIKELAEEFKTKFTCIGENTDKYITFTVCIEKDVTRTDKNGEGITKLTNPLSNFVNNLLEGIHRIKCKFVKNVKHVELNISIGAVFLNTQILKII